MSLALIQSLLHPNMSLPNGNLSWGKDVVSILCVRRNIKPSGFLVKFSLYLSDFSVMLKRSTRISNYGFIIKLNKHFSKT